MAAPNYKRTLRACYLGYVTQAIVNNLSPLFFAIFRTDFGISLSLLGTLVLINFATQLFIDLLAARFGNHFTYRQLMVTAHFTNVAGLICLAFLPMIMPPYAGLIIATMLNAVGGGLAEVVVSPTVEALPSDCKEASMSLLHSFYCWGHVGVVLISTIFFSTMGIENWKILARIWAVIPVLNGIVFLFSPIYSLHEEGEKGLTIGELFGKKIFWVVMLMMTCAGASEQAVSQWASTFAEEGLKVSKTVGDLADMYPESWTHIYMN